jgi:ribosome-binding protein aMBF1 (putative translation factor)
MQVRSGRETLGLTPEEFAERLRVPIDAIATWETGTMMPPRAVDLLMRVFFGFAEVRSALADETRLRTLGEAAA